MQGAYAGFKDLNGAQDENTQAALEALINLYDAWGKPEKAAEWRAKLEEMEDEPGAE